MILARFQRQPASIFAKTRMRFDEILFAQAQKRRKLCHFGIVEADLAGPSTTRAAALALKVDFHIQAIPS
jgi:hypothetical protein